MPQLTMNQLKLGTVIEVDGAPWTVIATQHVKVARGGATLRTKMRNLLTGATLERTVQPSETYPEADIVRRKASFLYRDGAAYAFMGTEDFEQFSFTDAQLGGKGCYLSDGLEVDVLYFKGQPVAASLPTKVAAEVAETPGSAKGDTAGNATKVATLAGGAELRVPMFVNAGDRIIVNTETDSYVERA